MKSSDFLAEIVDPNSGALSERPDDLRLAVNAILTADAFFGIDFQEQKSVGKDTHERDDGYRDAVAAKSECYRVLRDTAFALKHGSLTEGKKPRVVRRAEQTQRREAVWVDNGKWDDNEIWTDEVVVVEVIMDEAKPNELVSVRADKLVREVVLIAKEELNPTGRPPAKLADIRSFLN